MYIVKRDNLTSVNSLKPPIRPLIAALLHQAEETIPRITKPTNANSVQQDSVEFANIKRDLVNVIGNMSYKNRRVQDEVSRA